ncbi:MAG: hypothetical protein ACT4OZ_14680 [Gemmatimonadota bacterium]
MPRQKDLKRLVRARMARTGEAYTSARAQLLRKAERKSPSSATADEKKRTPPASELPPPATKTSAVGSKRSVAAVKPTRFAELAGITDDAIRERTGCNWERWVWTLDGLGASTMAHGDIAALVHTKYGVDGWWSQAVTVGYERIRGLREKGQRRDGSFEAGKSKTFAVPVDKLFEAWKRPALRHRWLERGLTVRTSTPNRSMRLDGGDKTIVAVWFTPKGRDKSSVAVVHTRLPDRAAAESQKKWWAERLDKLGALLAQSKK